LWYTKASLLLEDEEFSDALSWIECATAIEPDNGEIWLVRASIERSLNFPERAFVSIIRSFSIKTDYWKDENFREEAKLLSKGIVRSIQSGVEAVWGRFSK